MSVTLINRVMYTHTTRLCRVCCRAAVFLFLSEGAAAVSWWNGAELLRSVERRMQRSNRGTWRWALAACRRHRFRHGLFLLLAPLLLLLLLHFVLMGRQPPDALLFHGAVKVQRRFISSTAPAATKWAKGDKNPFFPLHHLAAVPPTARQGVLSSFSLVRTSAIKYITPPTQTCIQLMKLDKIHFNARHDTNQSDTKSSFFFSLSLLLDNYFF